MPIDLMTPTTVEIKVEEASKIVIGGTIEYIFYINGQEYKRLPLDANVREPDANKSKPYKDMINTLMLEPQKFLENNLGISVIASNVQELGNKRYRLTFPQGTGILNGGHTQLAILNSQNDSNISHAIVKISVREKAVDETRIAEIAAAQNSSTAVKEYSLAEKKGLFTKLKRYMDPYYESHIIWYEGKVVAGNLGMIPVDLIAMINLFDINKYYSNYCQLDSYANASFNSKKTVFSNWEQDSKNLEIIYPLVNDIIKLSEHIAMTFHEKTGMARLQVIQDHENKSKKALVFSGNIPKYNIPQAFLYAVLSAFRANVWYDAANRQIGWFENPILLYNRMYIELFKQASEAYKGSYKNEIKKVGSDSMLWNLLYVKLNTQIDKRGVYIKYDI